MDAKKINNSTDLFGNKIITIPLVSKKRKPKTLFDDYDGFVDKFEPKKTTDDCYTPPAVYDMVLNYVIQKCNIRNRQIIRPFYPGYDYKLVDYPKDCLVVDNPPFSIVAEIVRFYISNGVEFFLFAPHLTLFSADLDCTRIVAGANIVYENGAVVKTSFLSNMFGDAVVLSEPFFYEETKKINNMNKVGLPKYIYPPHVLTVSMVSRWAENGIKLKFDKKELIKINGLDSQKNVGKSIFGNGFLLSNKAAADKAAADKRNVIEWGLSEREKEIIKSLSK